MSIGVIRQISKHGFKPFERDFPYTGTVQSVTIPYRGLYKLEVWGGAGGYGGGSGGYSKGYKFLERNTVLYIVCGGQGITCLDGYRNHQSYNGGGSGIAGGDGWKGGSGGGATHIALVTGELKDIGYTSFVTNGNGLIVAGGGGGDSDAWQMSCDGGFGGGTSGGDGTGGGDARQGTGGTQTEAGKSKYAELDQRTWGGFGYGGDAWNNDDTDFRRCGAGGGGGLYGGGGAWIYGLGGAGGGGGSGWIDGVPELIYHAKTYTPTMTNGAWGSAGKAKITRIK